jgi:hypothetical protein
MPSLVVTDTDERQMAQMRKAKSQETIVAASLGAIVVRVSPPGPNYRATPTRAHLIPRPRGL